MKTQQQKHSTTNIILQPKSPRNETCLSHTLVPGYGYVEKNICATFYILQMYIRYEPINHPSVPSVYVYVVYNATSLDIINPQSNHCQT